MRTQLPYLPPLACPRGSHLCRRDGSLSLSLEQHPAGVPMLLGCPTGPKEVPFHFQARAVAEVCLCLCLCMALLSVVGKVGVGVRVATIITVIAAAAAVPLAVVPLVISWGLLAPQTSCSRTAQGRLSPLRRRASTSTRTTTTITTLSPVTMVMDRSTRRGPVLVMTRVWVACQLAMQCTSPTRDPTRTPLCCSRRSIHLHMPKILSRIAQIPCTTNTLNPLRTLADRKSAQACSWASNCRSGWLLAE